MKRLNFLSAFGLTIILIAGSACNRIEVIEPTASHQIQSNAASHDHDLDAAFIDVISGSVHMRPGGWMSLDVIPGIYDLEELSQNFSDVLSGADLPEGFIMEVRLQLGENNFVNRVREELPLKTPSGQQSGIKIRVRKEAGPRDGFNFGFDFDINRDVHESRNGLFILHPEYKAI